MTPAQQYAALVQRSRTVLLRHDAQVVRALERMLAATTARMRQALLHTPRGLGVDRYRREVLARLTRELEAFRVDYRALLDGALLESARIVEEREAELVDRLLAARARAETDVRVLALAGRRYTEDLAVARATLGSVPGLVLERLYARQYADGLRLSDRLYALDREARRAVLETVAGGIAEGKSARALARRLEPELARTGVDNVRYKALRIARTELNTAHREAHTASVTDPATGRLRTYVRAIGWRLSAAHGEPDVCDVWASQDVDGLGAGNYLPGSVPVDHPNGKCYQVTLLVGSSEEYAPVRPQPKDVPESQRAYYGV